MNMDVVDSLISRHQAVQVDVEAFKSVLKNPAIALDDRWSAFVKLVNERVITEYEQWGDGNVDLLKPKSDDRYELTLYDDFYVERYETVSYPDFEDRIANLNDDCQVTEESFDKWREAALRSGKAGFRFDW